MTTTAAQPQKTEDPRVTRTRNLITESFFKLLDRKDFGSITVQEITQDATVNRATFYAHFEDKYDLVYKTAHRDFSRLLTDSVSDHSHLNEDAIRSIDSAIGEFLNMVFGDCHLQRQLSSIVESAIHDALLKHITEWLDSLDKIRLDPKSIEIVAVTVSSALVGARLFNMRKGLNISESDNRLSVVDILSNGLSGVA